MWYHIPDKTTFDPKSPVEKISAMNWLLHEYKLLDFGENDPALIKRSKRLMAPFGIDPVPWADENGIKQEALSAAFHQQYLKRRATIRARYKEHAEKQKLERAKAREDDEEA